MRYLLIINTLILFSAATLIAQTDSTAVTPPDTTIVEISEPETIATPDIAIVGGDTILLNENYTNSFQRPLVAMSGDLVIVETDSIHLVNNQRFLFYEELRGVVEAEDNCNDQIQEVIAKYEESLKRNEESFNGLLDNCNKTSDLTNRLLETTETSLKDTKSLLTDTQTSLSHATDFLKEARKAQKASRKKNTIEKVLIGAGAAAVGVLTGVLIAN